MKASLFAGALTLALLGSIGRLSVEASPNDADYPALFSAEQAAEDAEDYDRIGRPYETGEADGDISDACLTYGGQNAGLGEVGSFQRLYVACARGMP
jgi:hypothetical protein